MWRKAKEDKLFLPIHNVSGQLITCGYGLFRQSLAETALTLFRHGLDNLLQTGIKIRLD